MKQKCGVLIALILSVRCQAAPPATPTSLPTTTPVPTATPSPSPTPTPDPLADIELTVAGGSAPLRITYIGNEGFLIEGDGQKIAVDALFAGFRGDDIPRERQQLMRDAAPPFDNIDLLLVTHSHGDHFEASIVTDHLVNNPNAVLVSTQDVVRRVQEQYPGDDLDERIFGYFVDRGQSEEGTFNGIDVKIIYLSHGPGGVRNNGYIVQVAGYKLLHMGDFGEESMQPLLSYHLANEGLDFAFVPYFYLMEEDLRPIVTEGIQARYNIPMHFYSTTVRREDIFAAIEPAFSNAILFYTELQTLTVTPN